VGLSSAAEPLPRWRKLITARRLRGRLYRFCSSFGYRRACNLIHSAGLADDPLDWTQIRGTMENWLDLRQGLADGWIDHVAVSTRQRQEFLAARGITAPFIAVGSCEELGGDQGLPRDLQVLFLGRVRRGPRAAKLARIEHTLRAAGIALTQITADCYGPNRTRCLNRTRLMLHLHNHPWSPAWIRFVMAAQCGAVVVSEPAADQEPFAAETHYAAAAACELPAAIVALLDDPVRYNRLRTAATALCRDSLTMLNSVQKLCSLTTCASP
jgi:hypothetical protein